MTLVMVNAMFPLGSAYEHPETASMSRWYGKRYYTTGQWIGYESSRAGRQRGMYRCVLAARRMIR